MTRTEKLALILFAFVLWAVTFAAFAGMSMTPGTPVHTHSDANSGGGTLALSGTLSSTKACATNYTRVSPNFCSYNFGTLSVGTITSGSACTQTTALTGVSDAKGILVSATPTITSSGAVGLKTIAGNLFRPADASCAGGTNPINAKAYEFSAVTTGTVLSSSQSWQMPVPSNATGQIYVKAGIFSGVGAGASFDISVLGYFD